MYSIDDYDLKILTLLQANGRLTNQELSELVGLSASQCSRRRIGLEQAQLILGAVITPVWRLKLSVLG